MAFWKENNVEPKRLFRFKVQMDSEGLPENSGAHWWAKSVDIPTFSSSPVEHHYLDNVYKFPGKIVWQNITLTMVDPSGPDAVSQVMNLLVQSGYKVKEPTNYETISKKKSIDKGIQNLFIIVIDAQGNEIEKWTVKHPMITESNFATFDYNSDDLREVSMTIAYDWAECQILTGDRGVTPRTYNNQ
jgi:hypothetical protein